MLSREVAYRAFASRLPPHQMLQARLCELYFRSLSDDNSDREHLQNWCRIRLDRFPSR